MSFEPGALFFSFVISLVGTALFIYGKKAHRLPQMGAGLALAVYPYFVDEYWTMLLVAAVILAALWITVRMGY